MAEWLSRALFGSLAGECPTLLGRWPQIVDRGGESSAHWELQDAGCMRCASLVQAGSCEGGDRV